MGLLFPPLSPIMGDVMRYAHLSHRMRVVSEFELAFYLFGGPLGDLYFIGTLSQTLSLRAAYCPFRICCRKYPDPAGRLTTTLSPTRVKSHVICDVGNPRF